MLKNLLLLAFGLLGAVLAKRPTLTQNWQTCLNRCSSDLNLCRNQGQGDVCLVRYATCVDRCDDIHDDPYTLSAPKQLQQRKSVQ